MEDETYQRLLGFGLNFISIRPRSKQEIRDYILRKIHAWKIPHEYLSQVIGRLQELGYVDDVKFAQVFISSRNRSRQKGKMLLMRELQKKGVSPEVVERAQELLQASEGVNDLDLARIAATKKLRSLQRYDRMSQRSKLYSFLARRGFDHTTISSVVDEVSQKGLQYEP